MRNVKTRFDERLELLSVLFYKTKYKEVVPYIVNLQEQEEYSISKAASLPT